MESVFLLSLVYPEKPENSVAKATELEYVKKNTKKKDGGIQMEKVTLFSHILPEEQERMWVCFQMREVVYENNEIIMEYTNTMKKIGLIAEGQASLYGSDAEGNQYLMDELKKDDVFGEPLLLPEMSQHYYVCAKAKTRVIFIDYEHVIKRCENACKFHSQMVSNLLQMIAMRASQQANRIYVLSRNSTRKKIMAYLNEVGGGKKKQEVRYDLNLVKTVPDTGIEVSWELSDYQTVNILGELQDKNLSEEGVLFREGKNIRILL